jgi:hypothetical protein
MAGDTRSGRVELTFVGDAGWRVCDASMPEDDGRRMVAFFERVDRHVEVLWIRQCSAPRRFDTLAEALAAADAVIAGEDPVRFARPLPIRRYPQHHGKAIA